MAMLDNTISLIVRTLNSWVEHSWGGSLVNDGPVTILKDEDSQPNPLCLKGKRMHGGPQMLQLSLDGTRLYVSSSLYSSWDRQFYPDMVEKGGYLVKLDVNVATGGITLDEDFLVEFDGEPDGPLLPHEMRYPGGDATSDIWLVDDC
ncbi:hypothetical protein PPYR_10366 [Photinus pyralis]|uniref:Selenium-binding protein 1 n=2 Tax=Photinus pyralis TaxID=7054 RepID=A0A5N4AG49_PHOPY|nr:hypothetical protein PPYR_10366 [Photinus pyralis]